jgi:outer membrane receptor protein involved in Fe transport
MWLVFASLCPVVYGAEESPAPTDNPIEAIVVKSEKLSVESLIDRKVYSVAADAQSSFGNLGDLLALIPSVDVDPSGIVSLRGDSKVLILIDGKPSSQFAGASAGDNLQSIPAKDIVRIEVLTTPPAQFKADGVAGVINIVTRKGGPAGSSASLQASAGNGGRYVWGADGSYRSGPLSASLSAGYRQDYRDRRVLSTVLAPDPVSHALTDSRNEIAERIRREVPTIKLSGEYAWNDSQSLSASGSWADRGGLRTYSQSTDSRSPQDVVTNAARRYSSGHDPETDLDERLSFMQKLGSSGQSLDFSLHRSTSHQLEHYDYINEAFVPPAATFYNGLSLQEDHRTTEMGADYSLPASDALALKFGYAFEHDISDYGNIAETLNPVSGIDSIDSSLTNQFQFNQTIHALYGSYQQSIDAWTWLAGLRAEEARTDAHQLTSNVTTKANYFELYPSLHVDRKLSEHETVSLGASRRVSRPDPASMNPYVDHEYTPNLSAGNPNLRPQFSRSFEVVYGYERASRRYDVTGYYRLNTGTVTDLTEYLGGGLSLTTKTNLPKDKTTGLEFSANGRLIEGVNVSLSSNVFYSQIDATALGIAGLQSTAGINAKCKLDYRPTESQSAQITLTRTDKRLTPQGYVSAINLVNLGYKYQLVSDLTAVATVTDLFNGQLVHRYSSSQALTLDYRRSVVGRILYVGLVYSFGRASKDHSQGFEYEQPP